MIMSIFVGALLAFSVAAVIFAIVAEVLNRRALSRGLKQIDSLFKKPTTLHRDDS